MSAPPVIPAQAGTPQPSPSVIPAQAGTPQPAPSVIPAQAGTSQPVPPVIPAQAGMTQPAPSVTPAQAGTPQPAPSVIPAKAGTPQPVPPIIPAQAGTPQPSPSVIPAKAGIHPPFLVIDTSTRFGAVGLWSAGGMERTVSWKSRNNHTAELMPAIDSLLRAGGVSPGELGGVIVTVGPGGFSAVRAGLGVAKGLAIGGSLPVAGVSSLEASAYPYRQASARVCALLPAGRDIVSWGVFGVSGSAWVTLVDETVTSIDEFVDSQSAATLYCGEAAPDVAERVGDAMRERLGTEARLVIESAPLGRLGGAGELGAEVLEAGRQGPVAAIEPRYLRPPHITQPNKAVRTARGAQGPTR